MASVKRLVVSASWALNQTRAKSVDHCHVALDYAGFLEQANTPETRRRREANLLRQLHVLNPAVALKGPKDAFVDVIKHDWNPISRNKIILVLNANIT